MFKGVIFDLDGTLIDSRNDLGNSVNRILVKHGLDPHPMAAYNQFVGNGIEKLVERAFPKDYNDLEGALQDFIVDYGEHCTDDVVFYPGILKMLETLNTMNIPIAVLTNKEQSLTDKIIDAAFQSVQFVDVIGDRMDGLKKPNPHYIHTLLNKMNLNPEETLYIGDSDVDVQTGHNAGLKVCGVAWGFRGIEELKKNKADFIVETADEILKIVLKQDKTFSIIL